MWHRDVCACGRRTTLSDTATGDRSVQKGKGQIAGHKKYGGKAIEPSDALLKSVAGNGVSHGDWIVLASLREAFNNVFDYSADEGIFRIKAWNLPGDVESEFRAAGYTNIVNKAGLGKGGVQSLEEASDRFDDGWRVILLVQSDIISFQTPLSGGRVLRTSNHWIGLNSPIVIALGPGMDCQAVRRLFVERPPQGPGLEKVGPDQPVQRILLRLRPGRAVLNAEIRQITSQHRYGLENLCFKVPEPV